jgi:uncharacterized membrane protein YphA (DoxX/SURF4 family)
MMQLPLLVAVLVALAEVGGGLAVIAGGALGRDWLTRLGGLVTVPVMLGAISMVHWGQWTFVATETHPMGGMEFHQVLLLLVGLYIHGPRRRRSAGLGIPRQENAASRTMAYPLDQVSRAPQEAVSVPFR